MESLAKDPEMVELLEAVADGDKPQLSVPQSEFTLDTSFLAAIADGIHRLIALTAAVNSKKGKYRAPAPMPRPVSALGLARSARRKERHLSLVAEVREAQARYAEAESTV